MRHIKALALAGLAALLAACGTERGEFLPTATRALSGLIAPAAEAPDVRQLLTPEVLARIEGSLIIVEVPSAPSQAGLSVAGTNGPYVTWAAENSTLVITNRGIVTGSRGLGFDLMNADVSGTLSAMAQGGGTAVRVHRYLDGVGKVLERRFECRVSAGGQEVVRLIFGSVLTEAFTERCEGELGGVFENRYWRAIGTSEMMKSVQWLSPEVGNLLIERAK